MVGRDGGRLREERERGEGERGGELGKGRTRLILLNKDVLDKDQVYYTNTYNYTSMCY